MQIHGCMKCMENSINRKHEIINNYITHNDVLYFTLNDVKYQGISN